MHPRTIAWLVLSLCAAATAHAQSRFAGPVAHLVAETLDDTPERIFQFLETLELFDVEGELDRLVGSPWELNEATAYKLALLPFQIRYPIYRQLVAQMTRQDQLRSQRIQSVSAESASIIALDLASLDETALDYDSRLSAQVQESLGTHFTDDELVDLIFFMLAQQRSFPENQEGWHALKRRIAGAAPALIVGGLVVGAVFDLGTISFAHPIVEREWGELGWYAGMRRLGAAFRPQLRGGLTLRTSALELAAGWWEQVNPGSDEPEHALELAVREGWLRRYAAPIGWDIYFEAALRHAFVAGPGYAGVATTARAGVYGKRRQLPSLGHATLRASGEVESDGLGEVRYAVSLGLEHEASGVIVSLQASRSPVIIGDTQRMDTRGGAFVTWTLEPWHQTIVDAMYERARLVMDEWDELHGFDRQLDALGLRLRFLGTSHLSLEQARAAVEGIARASSARDAHLVRMADRLADYLESRRTTYRMLRWPRTVDDLYGPLDPDILAGAWAQVFSRLDEVSGDLEETPASLERLRRAHPANDESDEQRRAGDAALARVETYRAYRDAARRMVRASGAARRRDPDPLPDGVIRRVLTWRR